MELLTHHTGEKTSDMISPLVGCREELQIPRSRDDGDGGYRRFSGILIGYLGFLHRGILIGEEARVGGGQGAHTLPRHGPTLGRTWGVATLWSPSVSPLDSVFFSMKY